MLKKHQWMALSKVIPVLAGVCWAALAATGFPSLSLCVVGVIVSVLLFQEEQHAQSMAAYKQRERMRADAGNREGDSEIT